MWPGIVLVLAAAVSANAGHRLPISKAATDFVEHGPHQILGRCALYRHRCGAQSLKVLESSEGDSNDEHRLSQVLAGPGMVVGVSFVLDRPPYFPGNRQAPGEVYYLTSLKLSQRGWPVPAGIDIGSSRAEVLRVLGSPSEPGRKLRYVSKDGTYEAVVDFDRDERVNTITWDHWLD
jgi:hypothetical protein